MLSLCLSRHDMEASKETTDHIFVIAMNIWMSKVTAVPDLNDLPPKLFNIACNGLIRTAIW